MMMASPPYRVCRRMLAPLLLVTIPWLGGCSRDLNTKEVERLIATNLGTKLGADGLTISSVSCPTKVAMKKGNTFECKASFEGGGELAVQVEQKDSEGNIVWKATEELVLASKVEGAIAAKLKQKGVIANVACSERVYPSVVDSTFQCTARDPSGQVLVFDVTVTSAKGDVSFAIANAKE